MRFLKKFNENFKDRRIENCVEDIMSHLSSNGIETWDDFLDSDRNEVNKLIDITAKDMEEVREIKFHIKLNLFSLEDLSSMMEDYKKIEDYEKCALIRDKISKKSN